MKGTSKETGRSTPFRSSLSPVRLRETQATLRAAFPALQKLTSLNDTVSFVTTQELEDLWPDRSPKEREKAWVEKHPLTFLMGIGGALRSGSPHDLAQKVHTKTALPNAAPDGKRQLSLQKQGVELQAPAFLVT